MVGWGNWQDVWPVASLMAACMGQLRRRAVGPSLRSGTGARPTVSAGWVSLGIAAERRGQRPGVQLTHCITEAAPVPATSQKVRGAVEDCSVSPVRGLPWDQTVIPPRLL